MSRLPRFGEYAQNVRRSWAPGKQASAVYELSDNEDRFPRCVSDVEPLESLSFEEAAHYFGVKEPEEEASNTRSDSRSDEWRALRAQHRPDDKFWHYTNRAECWTGLAGEAGIALVRGEEILGTIVTMMS